MVAIHVGVLQTTDFLGGHGDVGLTLTVWYDCVVCGASEVWWRNAFSKQHHRQGTPHVKWEAVFVKTFGLDWHRELFLEQWCNSVHENEFIANVIVTLNPKIVTASANVNLDEIAEKMAARKKLAENRKVDEDVDLSVSLNWQAANDDCQRVELTGDSILVTRWVNGHWP